jgi:tetratricopeptide (TPR) repeat protein
MTAVSLTDLYGNPVSSGSRAAVDAYDRGVRGCSASAPTSSIASARRCEADPDFVLARAALATSLYLAEKIPEGRAEMDRAAAAAASLPLRERRHVEALALWVGGRAPDAVRLIKECLVEHPRDMVLMQRLYYIYFWQGRSAEMLELTQSVRHALGGDGFMLGYHAFALEENRRFDEALPLAERAIAMNPRDAWAVHTVAHVLYERGENARGVDLLPLRIDPCDHLGYFKNHLLWHLALMHLAEGRYDHVGRLFESVFGDIPITVGSDLQDSVASPGGSISTAARILSDGSGWARRRGAGWRCPCCSSTTSTWGWPWPPRATGAPRRRSSAVSASAERSPAPHAPRGGGATHGGPARLRARGLSRRRGQDRADRRADHRGGGSHAQREVFHDTLLEAPCARGRRSARDASRAAPRQAPESRPALGRGARVMDWPKIGEEAVELTRGYLRVNTTNPPGGETAGTRFLAQVLDGAGMASETAESAPGRGNLVARVRGDGSLGGIVLHHHIDVVYADERYWTVDPFGGCSGTATCTGAAPST